MPWDLIVALAEVAQLGARAAARRAKTRNDAHVAWERAAALLRTKREDDPQNADWKRFVAIVDGHSVTVDSVGGIDGHTRVAATSTAPRHERVSICAAGGLDSIARAVGAEDVPLGDAGFDERFMVKGNDAEFTRMWVNSAVRKRIAHAPNYRFELANRRVTATKPGLETDAKRLVRAVRAVAAFANGRQRVLRSWGRLAKRYGATLEIARGRWASMRGAHKGVSFTLDTYEHAGRHFTTVAARVDKARLVALVVAHERHGVATTLPRKAHLEGNHGYRWFAEEPERARALLGPTTVADLIALGVVELRVDPGLVKVTSAGICVRPKTLSALIALACRICRGGDRGPYR